MVVQPTFLYELLWNLFLFVVLIFLDRRFTLGHGRLFATYVAGYCIGRFWVELLRDDTATHIAGIRINSFTSTFVLIGAVVYLILAPKGREDPATLSGSAAELLEPDSIGADEANDSVAPAVAPAETPQADTAATETAAEQDEAPAVETPDADAEAVAAEADAAEVDPPAVEVEAPEAASAETPEAKTPATETAAEVEAPADHDEAPGESTEAAEAEPALEDENVEAEDFHAPDSDVPDSDQKKPDQE
jgi:Prolipoprotein diacylglyceryl transferase